MTDALPEEIRWCVERYSNGRRGGPRRYPDKPGAVRGSVTSEGGADFMDGERRTTVCERLYQFLMSRPGHRACRRDGDVYLAGYGHEHGGIRRFRDLVMWCWAYEPPGETIRSLHSGRLQQVVCGIGPPQQPAWGDAICHAIVAEEFHRLIANKAKQSPTPDPVSVIIEKLKDWEG